MNRDGISRQHIEANVPIGTTVEVTALCALRQRARIASVALNTADAQRPGTSRITRRRSRGMEYAESRGYSAGDDARHIDWRASARSTHPYTKLFHESRTREVSIVVDVGASMHFGTRSAFKSVVAAHAAMLLAWAATEAHDHVSAMISATFERLRLPAREGTATVLAMAGVLSRWVGRRDRDGDAVMSGGGSSQLAAALKDINAQRYLPSLLVVVSDLYGFETLLKPQLTLLATRAEVLLCWVVDALELTPPPPGRYPITDGMTFAQLDTRARATSRALREQFHQRATEIDDFTRSCRSRCVTVATGADVAQSLAERVPPRQAGACFERP